MLPEILISDQQHQVSIPAQWITEYEHVAHELVQHIATICKCPDAPLLHLGTVEITLVDDAHSAEVHQNFMNIEGATDVITFHHGEIIISAETAVSQSADYNEPLARELMRYMIHGLLHLAGYDDQNDADFHEMESVQERMVAQFWKNEAFT